MGEQFGRYRLDEILGQGGMGVVYRAWDSVLERVVALKMVLGMGELDRDVRERFLREARSAAQLTHKNIVTIYDLGEHEGRLYLAMEFLDGEDLQHRLARTEKTSFWRKVSIAIEICQGIEFAHAHGVIHRDLKPGNIFITASGGVKILDFGLARFISSQLTQSNMLLGTINYMAPEQVRGERADHQTDVFSIGVVLYELFGRRRAFEGDSAASTLYKILQEFPEPLWKLDAELPRELVAIIDRALAKPRDERYPDVASMRRDLELLQNLGGQPGLATPWPAPGLRSPATPASGGYPPPASGPLPAPSGASPAAAPGSGGLPVGIAPEAVPASGPVAAQNAPQSGGGAAPIPGTLSSAQIAPTSRSNNGFLAGAGVGALAVAGLVVWMANRHAEPPATAPVPTTVSSQARSAPESVPVPASAPVAAAPAEASATATPARPAADRRVSQKREVPAPLHAESPARRVESPAPVPAGRDTAAPPPPQASAQVPSPAALPTPSAATQPVPAAATGAPSAPSPSSAQPAPAPMPPPAAVNAPADVEPPALTVDRARELVQRYKTSLEAKSLDQLKRVWPSLGGAAETAVRQEFQHATQIVVGVSDVQVSAASGSGRISFVRSYSLVTVDGQRLRSTSVATMEVHRSGDVWLIDSIQFTPR